MMARLAGRLSFVLLGMLVILLLGSGFLISSDLMRDDLVAKYRNDKSFFYILPSGAFAHIRDEGKDESGPDKPAMFLIHGSNASLHTWEPWVARLRDDYRLISFDLPGHGLTGSVPGDDYSVSAMAHFVKEIHHLFKLNKVILVGNSMGGAVALQYALDHPADVQALVLVSPSGMQRDPEDRGVGAFRLVGSAFGREMMRYVTPRFMIENTLRKVVADPDNFVTEAMVDRYWELLRMTGSRDANIKRFAAYDPNRSLESELGKIAPPTLILWGAQDRLIKLKYGVKMSAAITDSQLIAYPELGHLAMEEDPTRTVRDTHAFLASVLH